MSDKEIPLSDSPDQEAGEAAAPADAEDETQMHLKEAYERARDDLKATAERLKTEIEQIDAEEIGKSASAWIKKNPGLSFALVVGAGLLVGKAISSLTRPEPPPTFRDRVRTGSEHLSHSAKQAAAYAADRLSEQAKIQGTHLTNRLHDVKGNVASNAEVLGSILNEHAHHLGDVASDKTSRMISSFSDAAERAADSLQEAARDLSKSAKKYKKSASKGLLPITQASKTLVSAYIFKQLSDWIRKRG